MRKLAPALAALGLALMAAAPAQAEKWIWFQVKGGAVAFDEDSRKTDLATGEVSADTLIFYDQPRPVGMDVYSFVAERQAFECRGERRRWSKSAVLDLEGHVVVAREDSDWIPMGADAGSAGLFKRVLCLAETPPNTKWAGDFDGVMKSIRDGAPKIDPATGRVLPNQLAGLAFSAPKAAPPAASAKPAVPEPPASAPAAVPPASAAPKTATSPATAPTVAEPKAPPPAALAAAPAPKPVSPAAAPPASAGQTPYALAPRCVDFKQQDNQTYSAVNACAYRVNYAWCVVGGRDPKLECGAPFIARVSSTVGGQSQASSAYLGGLGRMHIFACRAPGTPMVREKDGRFDYECLGPSPSASASSAPPARPGAARPAPPDLPKLQR